MRRARRTTAALLVLLVAGLTTGLAQSGDKDAAEGKRPKFTLKAQPPYGITPARIVLTAELSGGDDLEEYYCPTVRWEWDDGTSSESTVDCAPYEAGKTELKRRFTIEHTFKRSGSFKVYVRLKQRNREIAVTSTMVQVQQGAEFRP
jgi:hypothetical protein